MNPVRSSLSLALSLLTLPAMAEEVRGMLVDASGNPMAGVELRSTGSVTSETGEVRIARLKAISGPMGEFTISNAFTQPSREVPFVFVARLPDGTFRTAILREPGGKATFRGESVRVKIRVVDSAGHAVAGADVNLESIFSRAAGGLDASVQYGGSWNDSLLNLKTDAEGYATFEGLPSNANTSILVSQTGMTKASERMTLPKEGEVAQTVNLYVPVTISGRVLAEGKPVAGVTVAARTLVKNTMQGASIKTAEDGSYRLTGVVPGKVNVYVQQIGKSQDWAAKAAPELQLAEGQERAGLNFVLEKGLLLQGRVLTQESGKPIPNAVVTLLSGSQVPESLRADAEGRFSKRVSAGEYSVLLQSTGRRFVNVRNSVSATLDEKNNPELVLRVPEVALMGPITGLKGTVRDASGKPVAGATVANLQVSISAVTDAEGRYTFKTPIFPMTILIATKEGAMSTSWIEVRDQATIDLTLDGKPASMQGVVVGEDGQPMSGVTVASNGQLNGETVPGGATVTDEKGAFRFEGLFGGTDSFYVWAKKPGFGPVTIQSIRLASGENKALPPMKLMLADGVIEGTVYDTDGKPAKGVNVSSQVTDVEIAVSDEKGRFRLTGVPRGEHYIVASRTNSFRDVVQAKTGQSDVVIKLTPEAKPLVGVVFGDRIGMTAPALKTTDWFGSKPLDLKSLRGKIVVIDFWAVWCGPCIEALPEVQALYKKYGKDGVVVIGMHAPGTPKQKIAEFIKQKGLTYPNALDIAEDSGVGQTALSYGPEGIPHMFVIDRLGKIVTDTHDVVDVERAIQRLLKKG
ncbi:redoxin domain-containing protein [bacterium]|nr:MAG: redoxin domain-containing protein [bacterium]